MNNISLFNVSSPMYYNMTKNDNVRDRGDWEKVLAMVCLGGGSFISGMLPAYISERNRNRFPLVTSLLLCFGAGILLATAMVHILPEVREKITNGFAEIYLCGGFFIIYFVDEFIHYFFGEAIQHAHHVPATESTNGISHSHSSSSYGSTETAPLLHDEHTASSHGHSHVSQQQCNGDTAAADANARICHTSHTEPCAQTNLTGTLGLFVALSLHSLIEGLAIGVQNSSVLFLMAAVACHKFVMGFCLGLELRSNGQTSIRSQFIGILVFALGAVCGIGVGMLIVDTPSVWMQSILPIIQALAGGTLLYVTVCEVIPREKAKWHQNPTHKTAGLVQFFIVACGFAIMSIINYYLKDTDGAMQT